MVRRVYTIRIETYNVSKRGIDVKKESKASKDNKD